MKLHLETGAGLNLVRGYVPGCITVNQATYHASLVVLPDCLIPDWPPQAFADLRPEHFERIRCLDPEIVVLGKERDKYADRVYDAAVHYYLASGAVDEKLQREMIATAAQRVKITNLPPPERVFDFNFAQKVADTLR